MSEIYEIKPVEGFETLSQDKIIEIIKKEKIKTQGQIYYCDVLLSHIVIEKGVTSTHDLLVYEISDTTLLDGAAKKNVVLGKNSSFVLNQMAIVRQGEWIDKLQDTQVKILDDSENNQNGYFSSDKKLSLIVQDLRIGDYVVYESTIKTQFLKEDLRYDYFRRMEFLPNFQWLYGLYEIVYMNKSDKNLSVKKSYFRDENGILLPDSVQTILPNEDYSIKYEQYSSKEPQDDQIASFMEFTTQADYPELSSYLCEIFDRVDVEKIQDYAPDLVEKLEQFPNIEEKIRYAIEFVQDSIYYLYNGDEMDGYAPESPAKTYKLKQGDCKAKSFLLKDIMSYLGIDTDVILVNYRADFFLSNYLPSILNFNHAINLINYNGKKYLIDPTRSKERGLLENRDLINVLFYLPVKKQSNLCSNDGFKELIYEIEKEISCDVKDKVGEFKLKQTVRKSAANGFREYFKNSANNKVIEFYQDMTHCNMYLTGKFRPHESDKFFADSCISVLSDDLDKNELVFEFKTKVLDAYQCKDNQYFLHYWDYSLIDQDVIEFYHQDFPFLLNRLSVKSQITLNCDEFIDTKEEFTNQECKIDTPYFYYQTKKHVYNHGASLSVEMITSKNQLLYGDDLKAYQEAQMEIKNSNFGLGIDIVKPSLLKIIKEKFFSKK